jgi:hypothetical protein
MILSIVVLTTDLKNTTRYKHRIEQIELENINDFYSVIKKIIENLGDKFSNLI